MKKLSVVLAVAAIVQSTALAGMQQTKTAALNNEKPSEYENDVLGTFVLLGMPVSLQELFSIAEEAASKEKKKPLLTTVYDAPVSPQELLFIAGKKASNQKKNPLLVTVYENGKKPEQKKRKRKQVFQISGLILPGRKNNLADFERIYGTKNNA